MNPTRAHGQENTDRGYRYKFRVPGEDMFPLLPLPPRGRGQLAVMANFRSLEGRDTGAPSQEQVSRGSSGSPRPFREKPRSPATLGYSSALGTAISAFSPLPALDSASSR